MNWIKQKIARWVNKDRSVSASNRKANPFDDYEPEMEFKNPLNITLYNAVGGRIVKFHSYSRQTDKSYETTYIVPSDQDFEEALGHFITLEALKHKDE